MVFTENQATQFYVVSSVTDFSDTNVDEGAVAALKTGEALICKTSDGKKYLQVKGADTVLRSALIDPKTVMQVTGCDAEKLRTYLKSKTIKFSADHGDTPIVGQDYTMHIIVRQYQGISDEQNMVKTAAVHVTSSMTTAEQFYTAMKNSLVLNFKRELNQFFDFSASADGITITEKEQDWKRGTFEQVPVYFDVIITTVYKDGDEVTWGEVTDVPQSQLKVVGNGKKIADMEYFLMGERGDQYRQIGWPNYVPTSYLVDPSKEYNTLNIHFAYVGSNESVQKSEKDIMIVSTVTSVIEAIGNAIAKGTSITYSSVK